MYESTIAAYYDWLSRYQTLASWLRHTGGFDALTVHRLLSPDRPGVAAADVVHDRLFRAVLDTKAPRVVDAGCGVGGTIFYLHDRLGGRYDGLTLSRVQRTRAVREAARRRISSDCRFHVRSYDAPLEDLLPDGTDLIVAIESLAHAADPAHAISNLARALRPHGRLAIIDDVPADQVSNDDPDLAGFRQGWSCPILARESQLFGALAAADLEVELHEDLTRLVPLREEASLERLIRSNRRWHRLIGATTARTVMGALHGGLMLERLYRRGLMRYRFLLARRSSHRGGSGYTLAP